MHFRDVLEHLHLIGMHFVMNKQLITSKQFHASSSQYVQLVYFLDPLLHACLKLYLSLIVCHCDMIL